MSIRRILIILVKDLKDAIRDARVLFALLLPLGIGLFYNATFTDDILTVISAEVVYASAGETRLPALVAESLAGTVNVEVELLATAAEVEARVRADEADLGIVVPAGFDAAVAAGEGPALQLFTPPDPGLGSDLVAATLPGTLRRMAGSPEPAAITVTATATVAEEAPTVFDRLGPQDWAIMSSLVTMIGMIAMLAVPIVLAEEAEKRTLDALTMVSSYAEVVVGKALLGVVYTAVMVPLLLILTQHGVVDWPIFIAATVLVTVALLGLGLLMAGLFKSANQLNTWAGLFLLPVIAPAFLVAIPLPDVAMRLVERLPTGEAAKLLLNASTGERLFEGQAVSLLVIALWAVVAYALLLWRLSRREG